MSDTLRLTFRLAYGIVIVRRAFFPTIAFENFHEQNAGFAGFPLSSNAANTTFPPTNP